MSNKHDDCMMTRRDLLRTGGLALGMCAAGQLRFLLPGISNSYAADSRLPNFIIIYCDDLGYGDLGCYGSRAISTPNVDRMANEGIRLTGFYACASVCAPSRAGLLTGRYPMRSGIYGNVYPEHEEFKSKFKRKHIAPTFGKLGSIDLREKTVVPGIAENEILLGEALKTAGYTTGMVGKWHLGDYSIDPKFNPIHNGFDFYFGVPHSNDMDPYPLFRNDEMIEKNLYGKDLSMLTGLYTKEALKFVRESRSQGKPFFLYFAHTFPHQPLWASQDFDGKSMAGKFGDAVEEIDWSVGRIFETLKELGIDDNTFVIFTSDNGPWYEGSAGSMRGRKGQSYDGGFHVPMIARWPGRISAGTMCSQPVMNLDLYPTLLSLAGVKLPTDRLIDGRDIFGLLNGEENNSPHEVLFFYHYDLLEGVRFGKWKYIRKTNRYVWPIPLDSGDFAQKMSKKALGKLWPLLYNLETDPGENYNVIDHHPDIAEKMEAIMREWEEKMEKNPGGWL